MQTAEENSSPNDWNLSAKLIAPQPGYYAVIQIDPKCTMEQFDDAIVMAELDALQIMPKKYLVQLDWPLELPMPQSPFYGYTVHPIATTLRREDSEQHLTQEMGLPIFPRANTNHPSGRAPIRTNVVFPFANCYQWYRYEIDVYVKSRPDGFDHSIALGLTDESHAYVRRASSADFERAEQKWEESLRGKQQVDDPAQDDVRAERPDTPLEPPTLLPVVDLWLDLTMHLTEATIPDPDDLFKTRCSSSASVRFSSVTLGYAYFLVLRSIFNRYVERTGGVEANYERYEATRARAEALALEGVYGRDGDSSSANSEQYDHQNHGKESNDLPKRFHGTRSSISEMRRRLSTYLFCECGGRSLRSPLLPFTPFIVFNFVFAIYALLKL